MIKHIKLTVLMKSDVLFAIITAADVCIIRANSIIQSGLKATLEQP